MTIHTLWPTHIMIEDDFMPPEQHDAIKSYLYSEYKRRNQYPLLEFNHESLPVEFTAFAAMMNNACTSYALHCGEDPSMFELNNFQTHMIGSYNEKLANEHIMEPHHDMMEGGYYAILYYVDIDPPCSDPYVGGTLTIYKTLTSMDYPSGIVHIDPKPNRFVIFPAHLVHRVKPYFGTTPRLTIATLMRKERSYNQNRIIPSL